MPVDWQLSGPIAEPTGSQEYVVRTRRALELAYEITRKRLKEAMIGTKEYYDKKGKDPPVYQPGDAVYVWNPAAYKTACRKFKLYWEGPVIVTEKFTDVIYHVRRHRRDRGRVVHVNYLKPYRGDAKPTWFEEMTQRERMAQATALPPTPDPDDDPTTVAAIPSMNYRLVPTRTSALKKVYCAASHATADGPQSGRAIRGRAHEGHGVIDAQRDRDTERRDGMSPVTPSRSCAMPSRHERDGTMMPAAPEEDQQRPSWECDASATRRAIRARRNDATFRLNNTAFTGECFAVIRKSDDDNVILLQCGSFIAYGPPSCFDQQSGVADFVSRLV